MQKGITPEYVMQVGEAWKRAFLLGLTPEELQYYLPDYQQRLFEQARKQGCQQGFQQGIELGRNLAKREIAQAMLARNFEVAIIVDVTGLTIDQVKAILAEATDTPST